MVVQVIMGKNPTHTGLARHKGQIDVKHYWWTPQEIVQTQTLTNKIEHVQVDPKGSNELGLELRKLNNVMTGVPFIHDPVLCSSSIPCLISLFHCFTNHSQIPKRLKEGHKVVKSVQKRLKKKYQ